MRHRQVLFVVAALLVGGIANASRVRAQVSGAENAAGAQADRADTIITLRWGTRPGVSRYRLQLAADASFTNIVFDRVVQGQEYPISDLAPGRYFWRVAPLTEVLGAFSSAGVIDIAPKSIANPTPRIDALSASAGTTPEPANAIRTGGGWFAAVGNVARPILAHLRTSNSFDLIATIDDGRVIALDAVNGRALWTVRTEVFPAKQSPTPTIPLAVVVPAGSGLDNVLLLGTTATMVDGRAGRVLGKTDLPTVITRATVSGDRIFAIDSSLQKLFVLSASDGRVLADVRLPGRVVGELTSVIRDGGNVVMIALDDGRIQILDGSGKTILEGNAAAHAMTAPLVVRTPRGELVLVGTTGGLTALNADDLRPLGRVTLKGDHPRGALVAGDLDGDGIAEIITFTDRGRVVVVKSDEGKILFEADAKQADSAAFADINGDGILDLLMTGHEEFAFALSGRDGAMIWKSNSPSGVATNHASLRLTRSPFAIPTASGVLLITADSNGLRAVEFHKQGPTPG